MGALVGVDLTELPGESAKHYEADMAITLEEKGTWTYTSIRDNKASLGWILRNIF